MNLKFKIQDIRLGIKYFFINLWLFRKELCDFRPWDGIYTLDLMKKSLEVLCNTIEKHGTEIDDIRFKKIKKIKRAIELLEYHAHGDFIELAEKQSGVQCKTILHSEITKQDREVYKLADKIEDETWEELFIILKGELDIDYYGQDGTGLKAWWD